MAKVRKRGNWKLEDLKKASEEVKEGKLSVRAAAEKYAIPKSTVYDHSSSKVKEVSRRPGPAPILTSAEEKELVDWIISMAEVGYGQCREQVCKHFVRHISPERPVCLLVDGHTSHINLETSKFCKENNIYLYCLPPHSSHITQPLDVGFFSPLKAAWKKAVMEYNSTHPGETVNKSSFAQVFRRAYLSTVKPETVINAFRHSGIYPPNYLQIDQRKLQPAKVYEASKSNKSTFAPTANQLALHALEEEMDEETKKKYETRLKEGFDLPDPLYDAWKKLKQKTNRVVLQDISNTQGMPRQTTTTESSTLKNILQVPTQKKPTPETRSIQGTACLPKVISSEEVIHFLEERKAKKEMEEKMKQERQQAREERKKTKEEEKKRKEEERKEKSRQREKQKEEQRKKKQEQEQKKAERKRKREEEKEAKEQKKRKTKASARSKQQESDETSADECICPKCDEKYDEASETTETWIECEVCGRWYHLECAGVDEEDDFICQSCQ